jgi:hypothetical protein
MILMKRDSSVSLVTTLQAIRSSYSRGTGRGSSGFKVAEVRGYSPLIAVWQFTIMVCQHNELHSVTDCQCVLCLITVPQYWHIALTAVATVHIGNSVELIS